MEEYFKNIERKLKKAYEVATKVRALGYDPEQIVEIPIAKDMAERVEGLVSITAPQIINSGVSKRLHELEKSYGVLDWRIALKIAEEVADERFCKFDSRIQAIETGIRVGFAYITLGTVSSPLEGFMSIKIKKRNDGKDYFAIYYAGPIRSAGGTAAAVSVLLADYLRKKFGFGEYDATENEILRAITEIYDYHERITNLQYLPSEKEIEFLIRHIPVQIDGNASEDIEASNHKDLPRIETNKLRNGPCLVICECIAQKAVKLWTQLSKWGNDFSLSHWSFLEEFTNLQKRTKGKIKSDEQHKHLIPNYTYIQDLVAGRPVLTHPLTVGGFRLRYGRARNSGYSSSCIHPATGYILNKFIAVGTQLKVERPGKATAISFCDSIDGPIVKLRDQSVVQLETLDAAKEAYQDIEEIIFIGDILFSYGDFYNRSHQLVPVGYNEEWWRAELKKAVENRLLDISQLAAYSKIDIAKLESYFNRNKYKIPFNDSYILSNLLNIPIHPRYSYYWSTLSAEEFMSIVNALSNEKLIFDETVQKAFLKYEPKSKRALELLGLPHILDKGYIVIENDDALAFSYTFNNIEDIVNIVKENPHKSPIQIINIFSKFVVRDKAGTFVGARMGRPEKAKIRKLTGSPHVLFPVGEEGGKQRSFQNALALGKIKSTFPIYNCTNCNSITIYQVCEKCEQRANKISYCNVCGYIEGSICKKHNIGTPFKEQEIQIANYFDCALKKLRFSAFPDIIKGVRGTSNKEHIIEHLIKGILRAKYDIYVNKDGTTRYDMTQLVITHFKPKEISAEIELLKELGYTHDIYGVELTNQDQILDLKPQDIILPASRESPELGADVVLYKVGCFIDELLVKLYSQKPFYRFKSEKELIGHLVIALAPHTSAGIVARIIGFSKTQGFYAHPMLHAATRRDADGDEACVILLLDALINFSRRYLPSNLGSTQDEPLVLTSKLIPSEIDDMVFDLDICSEYPLELYDASLQYKMPWEVEVRQLGKLLKTENPYGPISFTHDVGDINSGVSCSAYKILPTMEAKLKAQMDIAEKIRAVDEVDVARLVIEKHFLRDIKGNLRKFSQQEFRCGQCNEKYRRPPLIGRCLKCGQKIMFTVSEGSIIKYLEPAISLANKYNLPTYLKQNLELTKINIESIFGKEREKQIELKKWFG